MNPYEDIINLPHPTSLKHSRMSVIERAAQFSPFQALSGYEGAIHETARLTDRKIELDEHAQVALNEKLCLLADCIDRQPVAAITYFRPDQKKDGGAYVTVNGPLKKIDMYLREIVMVDGARIPIEDTLDIESELLKQH